MEKRVSGAPFETNFKTYLLYWLLGKPGVKDAGFRIYFIKFGEIYKENDIYYFL